MATKCCETSIQWTLSAAIRRVRAINTPRTIGNYEKCHVGANRPPCLFRCPRFSSTRTALLATPLAAGGFLCCCANSGCKDPPFSIRTFRPSLAACWSWSLSLRVQALIHVLLLPLCTLAHLPRHLPLPHCPWPWLATRASYFLSYFPHDFPSSLPCESESGRKKIEKEKETTRRKQQHAHSATTWESGYLAIFARTCT